MKTKTYDELNSEFTNTIVNFVNNAKQNKYNNSLDQTEKTNLVNLTEKLTYMLQNFTNNHKFDYDKYPTIFKKYLSQKNFYENLLRQNAFGSIKHFEDGILLNILCLIGKVWNETKNCKDGEFGMVFEYCCATDYKFYHQPHQNYKKNPKHKLVDYLGLKFYDFFYFKRK